VNALCMGATDTPMIRGVMVREPTADELSAWMRPEQTAEILVQLLSEGPNGRTGDNIALWAGHPCILPPPEG
jgi:hypothetical protein